MPKLLFLLLFLLSTTPAFVVGQSCLSGGLTLSTQQQINDFPSDYPGCTTVSGFLTIRESSAGGITDLTPLNQLTEVSGRLLVFENADLASLAGLDNLATASSSLRISKNGSLVDLTGLGALTEVSSFFRIDNNGSLTSLDGLNAALVVDGLLKIEDNDMLTNLTGLAGVTQIGSATLEISDNEILTDISGLDNITPASIVNLIITDNPGLQTCATDLVCAYLSDATNMASIIGNATACSSRTVVTSTCQSLPVEYLSFTAKVSGKTVRLDWETTQELGNEGFWIQHSAGSDQFRRIGYVRANQASGDYDFLHQAPVEGINYYRLQQEDTDGTISLSETRVIELASGSSLKIYPNPAREFVYLSGLAPGEKYGVTLYAITGEHLLSTNAASSINVSHLVAGAYVLEVRRRGSVVRRQIMID